MEIIRYADLKPRPWNNGGGVTRELARFPAAAGNPAADESWDWRVSTRPRASAPASTAARTDSGVLRPHTLTNIPAPSTACCSFHVSKPAAGAPGLRG